MSSSQSDFIKFNLSKLGFSSKQDIIENLFLKSLSESYTRINMAVGKENEIRDRFLKDLHTTDSDIKKWFQLKIIYLDWENWVFTSEYTLARTDITFKLTGLEFIIECKRLKNADKAYIDEGLERFVTLKYSRGDEFAGMIGFITSGDKTAICRGLKDKIEVLGHTVSVSEVSSTPGFNSCHNRTDQTQISIYHLFFNFTITGN
ncbi:MAG: hypothetical protein MI921_02580 [Cytophagales bacterium]|nr:hypothetical protein [Cytophagales bacterium]